MNIVLIFTLLYILSKTLITIGLVSKKDEL